MQQHLYLILFVFSTFAVQNNIFTGKYSSQWSDKHNWSLNKCPDINDNIFINNKTVHLTNIPKVHIQNLYLSSNSYLHANVYINITYTFVNLNSTMEFINSTIYVWGDTHSLKTGILILKNSSLVSNANLIIDKSLTVQSLSVIPTNIINNGTLTLEKSSSICMGYYFNFTQTIHGKFVIYGFPHNKYYEKQYLFMCFNAFIKGTLDVKYGGKIGSKNGISWFLVAPSPFNSIANFYKFNKIQSRAYNVSMDSKVGEILIITLHDKF